MTLKNKFKRSIIYDPCLKLSSYNFPEKLVQSVNNLRTISKSCHTETLKNKFKRSIISEPYLKLAPYSDPEN
jgi:hypothetical protein